MTSVNRNFALLVLALSILPGSELCIAAEGGKSVYTLGSEASTAGMAPPPGTYISSFKYFYSGDASGSAALSRSLSLAGRSLPSSASLQVNADLNVQANVAIDIFSMLWVAPQKVMGGHFGVGAILPVGYQDIDAGINARAALTFPDGTTLQRSGSLKLSDKTFAVGDPLATAFLGWSQGNLHWKVSGLLNIPVGAYDRNSLVSMGFNRWAADLTTAATWLDPKIGLELSVASGFTFNGENPDTKYRTGTEFHVEAAMMQHFSKSFAVGVAAYHYRQVTGDSGTGALLGSFKGEVSAVGPNVTYSFQVGQVPVFTSVRWLREFNAKNRLEGDAGFLTVTVPLGGSLSSR